MKLYLYAWLLVAALAVPGALATTIIGENFTNVTLQAGNGVNFTFNTYEVYCDYVYVESTSIALQGCQYRSSNNVTYNISTYNVTSGTTDSQILDSLLPVISVSIPSTASTGSSTLVSVNCSALSPNNASSVTASWTNPNDIPEGPFNLTYSSGLFTRSYVFSVSGAYTDFDFYCRDIFNNTFYYDYNGTLTASIAAADGGGGSGAGGGGGGGGGTTIINAGGAAEIVLPLDRKVSQLCAANSTAKDFKVEVYNPLGTDTKYDFRFTGVSCDPLPQLSVGAKDSVQFMVTGCQCPEKGGVVSGALEIIDTRDLNREVAATLPITLSESIGGLFLQPKVLLTLGVLVVVVLIGFALILSRRR